MAVAEGREGGVGGAGGGEGGRRRRGKEGEGGEKQHRRGEREVPGHNGTCMANARVELTLPREGGQHVL